MSTWIKNTWKIISNSKDKVLRHIRNYFLSMSLKLSIFQFKVKAIFLNIHDILTAPCCTYTFHKMNKYKFIVESGMWNAWESLAYASLPLLLIFPHANSVKYNILLKWNTAKRFIKFRWGNPEKKEASICEISSKTRSSSCSECWIVCDAFNMRPVNFDTFYLPCNYNFCLLPEPKEWSMCGGYKRERKKTEIQHLVEAPYSNIRPCVIFCVRRPPRRIRLGDRLTVIW